ncbi:MAG: hypothetical protein M1832_005950 [Thelocarpon impressellum]|nr:MAG: hypothetical protein M1832_005950 [Thelocarpon impressellum]
MPADKHDMTTKPKSEPERDPSLSSTDSSAEPEPEPEQFLPEHTAVQKRKGGRKPIYATSEERKQRNRQAQAAFRERRTEYIKQLEATIKHHEESLQNLQQSHRSAADECLMLRYKNSLLERILLEKGIDVQAELNAKGDYGQPGTPAVPGPGPAPAPGPAAHAPAVQRAIMNRHQQARRSMAGVSVNTKLEMPNTMVPQGASPQLQPTPPSQTSSPSSVSQSFAVQGTMTPPVSDVPLQQQRQAPPRPGSGVVRTTSAPHAHAAPPMINSPEQEYDAQVDMIDDADPTENDPSAGPGPYPQPFAPHHYTPRVPQHPGVSAGQAQPQAEAQLTQAGEGGPAGQGQAQNFANVGELYGQPDLGTNDDQFGLWQSMTFPTPFSFPPSSMR